MTQFKNVQTVWTSILQNKICKWQTHSKRCSTELVIDTNKNHKRCHHTHLPEQLKLGRLTTPSVDEDGEQWEFSYIADRDGKYIGIWKIVS